MSCLSDEALAAWISGELDGAERTHIEGHCADCTSCRAIVVATMGLVPRPFHALGAVGATIGRYQVIAPVGQGSMGVVLRGHDPILERDVAIKMIHSATTTTEQRERMLREAKLLALVDHPNVVRVHDAGLLDDEVFVALEYITGPTLGRWLDEAPRSLAARCQVLAGVGAGIAAIHARGVVHRDIKADNILVRDGEGVIVDFGLARAADVRTGPVGSGIAGTPRFLAPEVRAGGPATELSDQFAWWTVVDDTMRDAPMSARRRGRLSRAIERGHADEPSQRFATIRHAVSALDAACESRPWRRWALVAGAAIAASCAALAIRGTAGRSDACAVRPPDGWVERRAAILARVSATTSNAHAVMDALDARADQTATLRAAACRVAQDAPAEQRTAALRQELCLAQTWRQTELLFEKLSATDPAQVRAGIDNLILLLPIRRCTEGSIAGVAPPPPAALAPVAAAIQAERRAIVVGPDRDPKRRVARLRAFEPRARALGYLPELRAWHSDLANALFEAGDFVAARREYGEALRVADTIGDDENRLLAMNNALQNELAAGNVDTKLQERAAEAAAVRLGNDTLTAQLRFVQSWLCEARGDPPGAMAAIREAIRLLEPLTLDAHPFVVAATSALGNHQQATGDPEAARTSFDRAYALARRRYGDDTADTLLIRGTRATNAISRGDHATARSELAIVEARLGAILGQAHIEVAYTRYYLCHAEIMLRAATARGSCDRALETAERALPAEHPMRARALGQVGYQRLTAGSLDDAIAMLERALTVEQTNPASRATLQVYLAVALHRARRDRHRAEQLAGPAIAELRKLPRLDADDRALIDELEAAFPRSRSP